MQITIVKIKKLRLFIYMLCFIIILSATVSFVYIDLNNPYSWMFLYLFSIAISLYYIVIYITDLFNRNAGIRIDEIGIILDFEYFKYLEIPWEDISQIRTEGSEIYVFLHDTKKYLDKIFKLSALMIKGKVKKLGTFILIHPKHFLIKKSELTDLFLKTFDKFQNSKYNKRKDN